MSVQVANNAYSTLAAGGVVGNALSLTINLASGSSFPTASVATGNWFWVTIYNASGTVEVCKVTDRTGNVLTVAARGGDGTTAYGAFIVGDSVECRLNAGLVTDLQAATTAAQTTASAAIPTASIGTAVPSPVGVGASGTWSININGNAYTATSATTATYLSATQQTACITGATNSLNMALSDSTSLGSFVCRATSTGDANLAGLSFYNDAYALKLGVRNDGTFGLGGWSRAAWSWYSDASGNMVAAGNVSAYSDPRLKNVSGNIVGALSMIESLNGVRFTWKNDIPHIACKAGKPDVGILANEVAAILPEAVADSVDIDGETYQIVAYEKLIPVLIEAVKELSRTVAELKARSNPAFD